jgi:hypothetical protein
MAGVVDGAGVGFPWNGALDADTMTAPMFAATTGSGVGVGLAVEATFGCGMLQAVQPAVALNAPLSKLPSLSALFGVDVGAGVAGVGLGVVMTKPGRLKGLDVLPPPPLHAARARAKNAMSDPNFFCIYVPWVRAGG